MIKLPSALIGAVAVALALPAWAQGPGGGPGGRRGPPPEASQACTGKSQGAACAFEAPHGTVSGTCGSPPGQRQLLCMPRGEPQGGSRRGPQLDGVSQGGSLGARGNADIDPHYLGAKAVTSKVPDTQQGSCFNTSAKVPCPAEGETLYGQDAHYHGPAPSYADNGDGTVTDRAMGLTWQQADDGQTRDWPGALQYCEGLTLADIDDWRLPNVKELQSLVDYSRNDPALDQRFVRQSDKHAWFWSSTSHGDNISMASYVCFGKCTSKDGVDTHGAGAQRADPKTGDPRRWPSLGGQHDEVRIQNFARCVR